MLLLAFILPVYAYCLRYVAFSIYNKHDVRYGICIEQWEFFSDTIDTTKEGVEQHRRQECLKYFISERELYSLGSKKQWTHESADKARDKTINKVYTENKQCELNEKRESNGEVLGSI